MLMIFSANSAVSAVKDYPFGDFRKALRLRRVHAKVVRKIAARVRRHACSGHKPGGF